MLLKFFIDLFTNIGQVVLTIIKHGFPQFDIASYMITYTTKIISICTQANNFLHFMLGDFVVVLVPIAIAILGFKYAIYPIITFIRSIFVNSN